MYILYNNTREDNSVEYNSRTPMSVWSTAQYILKDTFMRTQLNANIIYMRSTYISLKKRMDAEIQYLEDPKSNIQETEIT